MNFQAKEILFDDEGKGLFFITKDSEILRYLPISRLQASNLREIVRFKSSPPAPFFDPWVVYRPGNRRIGNAQFANYGTTVVTADNLGGLSAFDLNYYRLFPYSKRKYRLPFVRQVTGGKPVRIFTAGKYGAFALAVHADNSVKLHFVDQAFDMMRGSATNESVNDWLRLEPEPEPEQQQ